MISASVPLCNDRIGGDRSPQNADPSWRRRLRFVACAACLSNSLARAAGPAAFMMETTVDDQRVEGQPLWWNANRMLLLGRDGQFHEFDPQEAKDSQKTSRGFVPYSSSEMRAQLRDEFGRAYDVSATQHFVVVHPHGPWQSWADRLETLYRQFVHYMGVRGFKIKSPPAPLVAVVFRSQSDYFRYASANGSPLQPGTVGHYDPTSNRIFLFDPSGSGGRDEGAAAAATIVHEAAHQTAYNVGVHRRYATQPLWLVEGLAMIFEAPGVAHGGNSDRLEERINLERLARFRQTKASRSPRWVAQLVASDRLFDAAALTAYAEAWTLSFYLCETQPQAYASLLAAAARRPLLSDYSSRQRTADFAAQVGDDWELLAAQIERWIAKLP